MDVVFEKIITDALGFHLEVTISIGEFETLGRYIFFEDGNGQIDNDAGHFIRIKRGQSSDSLLFVVPHEVYHLFYAIRHLIIADEETEAEVFGELVQKIFQFIHKHETH